ncbi:MAG: PTS sugar transporter subunit IIA [Wenzhouxiangellaceae bacterium]|nr:PTS sugar transporter subunit IIA [Wenzhouxiangellaceae bacterium]
MEPADLLTNDRVVVDRTFSSKKSLLECAAELLSVGPEAASSRDIFQALCQRERLGSTGLGHGVAIPHCRVEQSGATGALIRLARPIDFDSPDGERVDLFFALSVPADCSESHLKLLSSIAGHFGDETQRKRLREAQDSESLIRVLREAPAGVES